MAWGLFRRKKEDPQKVTTGRFEIEKDGEIAYLEYSLGGDVLVLIHTEVPEKLRGHGLASALAETALKWARDNHVKVDIVCPMAQGFIARNPEYSDLVMH